MHKNLFLLAVILIFSTSSFASQKQSCHETEKQYKEKILKFLKEKEGEIRNAQKIASSQNYTVKVAQLGPVYYEIYEHTDEPSVWLNNYFSWEKIFKNYYLPAAQANSQEDPQALINLDYYSNSLLYDEEKRQNLPHYFYTKNDDEEILSRIIIKLHQRDYEFTKKQRTYLLSRAVYKAYLDEKRYDDLNTVLTQVYNHHFHFYKELTIKRVDKNTIILPLDPGNLDKFAQNKFEEIIYKYWSSENLNLKIMWVKNLTDKNIYYKVIGFGTNGKTYMDREERTINLYSGITEGTLAHELGHVLGFSDLYFDTWQKSKCLYVTQFNHADIMSSSTRGRVLAKHWEVLERYYPFQ